MSKELSNYYMIGDYMGPPKGIRSSIPYKQLRGSGFRVSGFNLKP